MPPTHRSRTTARLPVLPAAPFVVLPRAAAKPTPAALRAALTRALRPTLDALASWPSTRFTRDWWPGDAALLEVGPDPQGDGPDVVVRVVSQPITPFVLEVGTREDDETLAAPPAPVRRTLSARAFRSRGRGEPWLRVAESTAPETLADEVADLLVNALGADGTRALVARTERRSMGEPGQVVSAVTAWELVQYAILAGLGVAEEVEPEPKGLPRRVVVTREQMPFEIYLDDEIADEGYATLRCYAFLYEHRPFSADFLSHVNHSLDGASAYYTEGVLFLRSDLFLAAGVTRATVLRHLLAFSAQLEVLDALVAEHDAGTRRTKARRGGRRPRAGRR